ncbi:MAG: OmpA family protein [Bacteroidales bacterium]|jgi:outer membrane protein OmpA-like peptidoglycan-associated protein|nr:OmpA family protein [Bacteroidales bacterium]
MSNDLDKFSQGANILQQVDVSEIFTALAMGIADAQKKLDDNSVAQAIKLSEQKVAGKSLLELGFVPAFYSFTYADISASINLKMALKEDFSIGVGVKAGYDSGSNQSSSNSNSDSQQSYQSEKTSFRSNRRFSIKSSSQRSVTINNNHYRLNNNLGIVSRINRMHSDIIEQNGVDRLNINISRPIATRYEPNSVFTVLKITDYTDAIGNDVDSNGSESGGEIVIKSKTFSQVFPSGGQYGFSGNQMFGLTTIPTEIEVFFGFDKRTINPNYSESPVNNTDGRMNAMAALADVLRVDPSLRITVDGHCDSVGPDTYNDNLSRDRCNAMRDWLVSRGARPEQIQVQPLGEQLANQDGPDNTRNAVFRKVSISLQDNRDYIYYNSLLTEPTPNPTSGDPNYFIVPPSNPAALIINAESESAFSSLSQSETIEQVEYRLDQNTEIEFFVYSSSSETIDIRSEDGSEEEIRVSENESRREQMSNSSGSSERNSTFAISGSVDFRMSKQFEMSMEGNSSMSARMVAVPPPAAFIDHVNEQINE